MHAYFNVFLGHEVPRPIYHNSVRIVLIKYICYKL